jgi:hypothetical protein
MAACVHLACGTFRTLQARLATSVLEGRSQLIDATLYPRGKRWSVGWNGDFIEVLPRQKKRSYGPLEAWGVTEGDRASFR